MEYREYGVIGAERKIFNITFVNIIISHQLRVMRNKITDKTGPAPALTECKAVEKRDT